MFEAALKEKLQNIFDLDIVRYDTPAEDAPEQECIFVSIGASRNTFRDKKQIARVTGQIRIFANLEKFPYGYMSKKINEADTSDTKDFFFHEFEENAALYKNIVERTASFVFFYSSQYDPSKGTITSIELETA